MSCCGCLKEITTHFALIHIALHPGIYFYIHKATNNCCTFNNLHYDTPVFRLCIIVSARHVTWEMADARVTATFQYVQCMSAMLEFGPKPASTRIILRYSYVRHTLFTGPWRNKEYLTVSHESNVVGKIKPNISMIRNGNRKMCRDVGICLL